jgi:cytochrome c oxidase assembly protein subunit 15
LAAHLSLAFVIFSCLLWMAFSLVPPQPNKDSCFCLKRHGFISLGLLAITIIWGAFMAGKDAGLVSSTWPHMYQGVMVPTELYGTTLQNFFENEAIIHFTHRWIALIALIIIASFAWRVKSYGLGLAIFLQFALGIATVMSHVAIPIAAIHQGGAFIVTALLLMQIYRLRVAKISV